MIGETITGSSPSETNSRRAIQTANKIEQTVLKEHGDIRDAKTARKAVRKMFPNLKKQTLISPSNGRLSDSEYNYLVGMLHGASMKPTAARRLTELNILPRDTNPQLGGQTRTILNWGEGRIHGTAIELNLNCTTRILSRLGQRTDHSEAPWSFDMRQKMVDLGTFSEQDIDKVLHQNIALHEWAHFLHQDYGRRYNGLDKPDALIPVELYKRGTVDAVETFLKWNEQFSANSPRLSRRTIEENWELLLQGTRGATEHERHALARKKLSVWALNMASTSNPLVARNSGIFQITLAQATGNAITGYLDWDGVEESKRDEIRKELGKVSGYARVNADLNPFTQFYEGVAETISIRESTAGIKANVNPAASRFLRDVMTKQAETTKPQPEFIISPDELKAIEKEVRKNRKMLDKIMNDPTSCPGGFGPSEISQILEKESKKKK